MSEVRQESPIKVVIIMTPTQRAEDLVASDLQPSMHVTRHEVETAVVVSVRAHEVLPDAQFYPSTNPQWSAADSAFKALFGQIQSKPAQDVLTEIQAQVDAG